MLARRPVLRRSRSATRSRRPRETVLVILGSLLGTAIMTGSFVVGDTFDASIRRGAYEQLGPVDEVVSAAVSPPPRVCPRSPVSAIPTSTGCSR